MRLFRLFAVSSSFFCRSSDTACGGGGSPRASRRCTCAARFAVEGEIEPPCVPFIDCAAAAVAGNDNGGEEKLHMAVMARARQYLDEGGAAAVLGEHLHLRRHLLFREAQVLGQLLQQPLRVKVAAAIRQLLGDLRCETAQAWQIEASSRSDRGSSAS